MENIICINTTSSTTNSNNMSKTAKRRHKRLTVSGVYSGNR